jgi:hypothetical protein
MAVNMFHLQTKVIEGLTGGSDSESTSTVPPSSGVAGGAASYAAAIKSQVVKLQDELLVSKYRKDYEAAIINLDDLLGNIMLQQALTINLGGDTRTRMEGINALNILKNAKDSLNITMGFLDKQ